MLDAKLDTTDANAAVPSCAKNDSLCLTSLNPPSGADQVQAPKTESKPSEDSSSHYLTNLTIQDTNLNKAVDGYFAKADLDGNGYVDKSEVDKSKTDTSLTGEEGVIRSLLDAGLPNFQNQSNDEWGSENDGATRGDIIQGFDNRMKFRHEIDEAANVKVYIPPIFDSLDTDGNGFLTKEELTSPDIPDSSFALELKGALAADTLNRNFSDAQDSHNDGLNESKGLSIGDVEDYKSKIESPYDFLEAYFLDRVFDKVAAQS